MQDFVVLDWLFEYWVPIPGFEGLYDISNWGRVRTLNFEGSKGWIKILSPNIIKGGYLIIRLNKNGKRKHFLIHRLVALSFPDTCGKYFEKAVINHKDENTSNNCVWNLEWCTQEYNNLYGNHLKKISAALKGKNGKRVLQFSKDGTYIQEFNSIKTATERLGIGGCHISQCCNGIRKSAGGYIWRYA